MRHTLYNCATCHETHIHQLAAPPAPPPPHQLIPHELVKVPPEKENKNKKLHSQFKSSRVARLISAINGLSTTTTTTTFHTLNWHTRDPQRANKLWLWKKKCEKINNYQMETEIGEAKKLALAKEQKQKSAKQTAQIPYKVSKF